MEIGDVVHLKSGGAAMTVQSVDASPVPVVCHWHDESGRPCVERYSEAMLVVKPHAKEKDVPVAPSGKK